MIDYKGKLVVMQSGPVGAIKPEVLCVSVKALNQNANYCTSTQLFIFLLNLSGQIELSKVEKLEVLDSYF